MSATAETPKPIVRVQYRGLQSGCGITRSIPLFDVVAGPADLIGSTRAVESLEAEGYEVQEAEKNFAPVTGVFTPKALGETKEVK